MSKKGGLGRGFGDLGSGVDALFGQDTASVQPEQPQIIVEAPKEEVAIKSIIPNPYQPRQTFDEEKLQELAASIKEFGIVEPLVVRTKGKKYQLVAGERRLRAAKLAGLTKVPVVIREYEDAKMMEIALVENIQRHDLNPIEEAQGLKHLMEEFNLTQEQAAEKVGRSRVAIANILRLLNLPEEIQTQISAGILNMGQAKQLLGLESIEQQLDVAKAIIEHGWSSRMSEEVCKRLKEGQKLKVTREFIEEIVEKKEKHPRLQAEKDIYCAEAEDRMREFFGTKVNILPKVDKKGRKFGTIQIEYASEDELARICELLSQDKSEAKSTSSPKKTLNV
ncbi:MAG: ParB/RepB/Spo0J family partition protein [Phascolarctobacterium sp.]|nr:ParB/RepB/Spo0J family partition protein [Phascolarctobacterium sp.]